MIEFELVKEWRVCMIDGPWEREIWETEDTFRFIFFLFAAKRIV